MRTIKDLSDAEIHDAIRVADGELERAARHLQVLRGELWTHIRRRPALLAALKEQRDLMFEMAETILGDALDDDERWSIELVLKTMGARRGYGKYPAPPVEALPPEEPAGDLGRLTEEERKRYLFLSAVTCGHRDGIVPPDPEFVQRLDREIDSVRAALSASGGNLRRAAEQIGIPLVELQDYLALRPNLEEAIGDPHENLVDRAEAALWRAIRNKEPWAVRFLLTTIGRTRGYSPYPRDEIPQPKRQPHNAPDYKRLNSDELNELINLDDKAHGIEVVDYWAKYGANVPRYNDSPKRLD